MISGEERLHADTMDGLLARRASLPLLLATVIDRPVKAESLLLVITVWHARLLGEYGDARRK
jgi:hypothetical protein